MPVYIDDYELRPAPLVTIDKTFVKDVEGVFDHSEYNITLSGTIVNTGQSTDSPDAGNEGLSGILTEQKRIRAMLVDGLRLQILPPPAGDANNLDLYCTVDSVNFQQSVWVNRCDYSISLRSRV